MSSFKKRITVYASEIASLLGYNNFVDKRDAWDLVLKRNFNFTEKQTEKEKVKEKIDTFVEKNEDLIKEHFSKVKSVAEKENVLVEVFKSTDIPTEDIVSKARTMHGHETEKTGIDLFFKNSSLGYGLGFVETSCKPKIKYINPMFQLYGVIDGMMNGDTVIEHKARARRLFYQNPSTQIYKYEYIQVQLYMFLYEKQQAYLVETFEDKVNSRIVDYNREWLEENIFSKLNTIMDSDFFKNQESMHEYFMLPKNEKPNLF